MRTLQFAPIERNILTLSTGLSLTEHHGVQHKLREMAHTSNPHELASSFIDVSTMKKHGLSNHELSTVQAVASAMHARIFEKIKRSTSKKGNKQKASSKCPLQTELEDGGNFYKFIPLLLSSLKS